MSVDNVTETDDQRFIVSEPGTMFGLTTLDISPTQAQSDSEAPSSGPVTGFLTETIDAPSLPVSDIPSSALTTSTSIVKPPGRSVIFLVQASSNQERKIQKRETGGFVGADNPDVCTFALTFNLGDSQLFVVDLPIIYAGEDYKALGIQEEDSFVQGAITRTFGVSGGTLVFKNSGLPNGEAGFCQDSSGQVYITFTTSPSGCVSVALDVYGVTECQNGRLVGFETSTSTLAISTEASTGETGIAENVSSGVSSGRNIGEPTTAEATVSTDYNTLSSPDPSGTFSKSSGPKAFTTSSSQIIDTSPLASSPTFGSVSSAVSSQIAETHTSASSSVSDADADIRLLDVNYSFFRAFRSFCQLGVMHSLQRINTEVSSTEALSSVEAMLSTEALSSTKPSPSTEASLSTEALSSTEKEGSSLLTTTSNELTGTTSATFGSTSETSSKPTSSDSSDTSSSVEETTSDTSTTISRSSTEITTTTAEASTTTTELMTTTTTAAPQSECQSASSPYTVQGVDFDLSCDGVIIGGTSVGVAPATDFNQYTADDRSVDETLPHFRAQKWVFLKHISIMSTLVSMEQKLVLPRANITAAAVFQTFAYLVVIWIAYRMVLAIYNISPLHPLHRFPGPKIAAASYLYEAYYDWWRVGRYGHEIRRMHERYGPIVRINPDELHCSDPYFTDEIYAGPGRIRDKWQHQLNTGGAGPVSVTGFSTVNHEIHRMRKGALSKYFSRQQMIKLEGEVKEFAQMTVDKMLRYAGGEPFDVKGAFNCFTADIMSQYAFGESMGFIAQDGWEPNLATWVKSFFQSAYMMRHNVFARKMAQLLPFLSDYLGEDIKAVMRQMNVVIPGYIAAALKNPEGGRVFADVMESKSLPESEKSMYRLSGEGFNFLLAGTETTAAILTVITYYLLAQPLTYRRLMADLEGIDPQTLKWTELEQRPYLWAVIHEALRVMPGVSHRSARIAREEDLLYKSKDGNVEWVIPRGTPIGMTSMINHWDKEIFPNPDEFTPERWLEGGKPNFKLQKLLIAFGKGSRACIGENLAYCEVYIMAALLALRVIPRARLYETIIDDITYDHDLIVVQTKKGSISVRIAIS
ncbi:trichodiene oxygenase [Fusarium mexicanum]|uniref:Trichodiene oxygenase n=1 Tax=Fusarium mexicanum TaxID=751941 RepID=A0A8H5N7C1_9HYPO|nr:trichodiene oxygenase [Fusarium mexicanum]